MEPKSDGLGPSKQVCELDGDWRVEAQKVQNQLPIRAARLKRFGDLGAVREVEMEA